MRNPFRLGLKRVRKATPKAIYRFRRRVKRLRVYLALYTFPAEPPSYPALDKLFRRAGKLRQAYLNRDWVQKHLPEWKEAAYRAINYRKKRFLKAYKKLVKEVKAELKAWKKRFPPPWKGRDGMDFWEGQVRRWIEAHKEALRAFPSPPYAPEQIHELRTLIRRWELTKVWAPLPEIPPEALSTKLGTVRDLYLLIRWLQREGADSDLIASLQARQQAYEKEALALWESWRSTWA